MTTYPQMITFEEPRESGVRTVLVFAGIIEAVLRRPLAGSRQAVGYRARLRLRLRQARRRSAAEVFPGQHGHRLVPWSARFVDPIVLPDGRKPMTLRDAATCITGLPKAEHDAAEWQIAMKTLLLVAERDGLEMMARIGMMQALNRHGAKADPRRKRARAYRVIR